MFAPKNLWRPKNRPKFCAFFDNFRLWSRISPEQINISKIGKLLKIYNHSHVGWKKFVYFGPQTTEFIHLINLRPNGFFFGRLHFGSYGVLRPQIFTCTRVSPKLASAHPKWGGGPPKKFQSQKFKICLKFSLLESITSGLVGLSSRNFFSRRAARQGW